MFNFKGTSKNKRKTSTKPSTPISPSNENKPIFNIPSVSHIPSLPQNKSHGILPVLSRDGRETLHPMESENSETDLTVNNTTSTSENDRQPVGVTH